MRSAKGDRGRRAYAWLAAASSAAVLLLWWMRPGFLVATDLKAVDAVIVARGQRPVPEDIAIVAVDEASIDAFGRWPWPRQEVARLVGALSEARTIALDMVFSEPEGAYSDAALGAAIFRHGNVVQGYFLRGGAPSEAPAELSRSRVGLIRSLGGAAGRPWPSFDSMEAAIREVSAGASGFGAFNTAPGEDGIYRDMGLLLGLGEGVYPALPLEAVRRHAGGGIIVALAPYGVDSVSVGDREVGVDETGALRLNFYGGGGSFRTYSAGDVLRDRVPRSAFAGKLVFVGVTEMALADLRPTPFDSLFPGVELHATAAANILDGSFLVRDGRVAGLDILMVAAGPLALALTLSAVRRAWSGLLIYCAFLTASVAAGFALFAYLNLRVSLVYPALSLTLAYMSAEAYRSILVEKRGRYLKRAFSSYVSPELVSEILRDPERLKLGGERRMVTVLFADIRGFTSISEVLGPEELVELLNRYFSPMTGIVLDEGGMIDKYIGDAVMAVFNAPVEVPGHAGRAMSAALRMEAALSALNETLVARGYPELKAGIGINTGEAVVGNMGAELKLNYTAVGGPVNLASRLEGLTKLYGAGIIASEDAVKAAGEGFSFRELDLVKAKGMGRAVAIYELLGAKGAGQDKARPYAEGLALYRAGRFREARAAFASIIAAGPDGPSELLMKRSEAFIVDPPPDGWDGAFEAESK